MLENIQDGLAHGFRFFKLKLNGNEDLERVAFFRRVCELPFAIDINQAWQSIDYALNTAKEIEAMGCVLIEQPFDKFDRQLSAQLTHDLHIPVIADEACQGLDDIKGIAGNFDGINIKLQKCGGITPALELIRLARAKNLNILIGCMSESTIACSAAEVLSPLADWADLDGPWLIRENPDPETLFKS
jgi:L-alanine-DL-glutamate epimerase-like enolase superfamily enzyme